MKNDGDCVDVILLFHNIRVLMHDVFSCDIRRKAVHLICSCLLTVLKVQYEITVQWFFTLLFGKFVDGWMLRLIHTYHAVHLPYRAASGLDCVFPIWFTQCGRVWFTHAMPRPYHATTMPFWKRLLKAMAQRDMAWHCELTSAVQRRHVGDLPAFGFFRLLRGVPRMFLSEAYQSVKL
jgi:hypothetical protein